MYKLITLIIVLFSSSGMICKNTTYSNNNVYFELLYDNVWGTIYNPVVEQCNDMPHIVGDGSIIDIDNASKLRWIAISQNMLNCSYRESLTNDTSLYRGKLSYGDTIWIDSPYKEINGWWVVKDSKNVRYKNSIDFLQTVNDHNLYNNDKLWSGKFENIKIYKKIMI